MITSVEGITAGMCPQQYPATARNGQRTLAHRRLTQVFEAAKSVLFDDSSRIVFFSDCHRGNNGRVDDFAKNEELFLHALGHYYRKGFTYIEVGDGDDLWKHRRFSDIRRAHGRTFDLLHMFDRQDRLHLIVGNHDIQGRQRDRVERDGIIAREGLILCHSNTGQRIFVLHGHQADFKSDQLYAASRFAVRYIWKLFQFLGFRNKTGREGVTPKQKRIDRRITEWVQAHQHVVICGHTHRPMYPAYGAPPYFNTGSCVIPGTITGLEIQNGEITPVRWSTQPETRQGEAQGIVRELMGSPRRLRALGS
jgi:UDP-2,3-diacylglucosamine pyrophosphatase LpxH